MSRKTVHVAVSLVDGAMQEWDEGPELIGKLRRLQRDGYDGKHLVHALLTDDWGAPPSVVHITGTDAAGVKIDIRIPYR